MVAFRSVFDGSLFKGARCRVHGSFPKLLSVHLTQTFVTLHVHAVFPSGAFKSLYGLVALLFVPAIFRVLAFFYLEQRRRSNIYKTILYQLFHVTEEEGQYQGGDVRAGRGGGRRGRGGGGARRGRGRGRGI